MVQILPQEPSLGQLLGTGISTGIQTGIKEKMDLRKQLELEKQKQKLKQEQLGELGDILFRKKTPPPSIKDDPELKQNFINEIKKIETETGKELTDNQRETLWQSYLDKNEAEQNMYDKGMDENVPQLTPEEYFELYKRNPDLAKFLQQQDMTQQRAKLQKEKLDQQEKLAYLKLNEKQMVAATDQLERLQEQEMEMGRLEELFTTHANKMPSRFKDVFFNYKGEDGMSRLGRALLSDEAQEVLKILTSQIKGLNQTFRGRILEAEIKYYMRTWPELLNTERGRLMILNDITKMNKVKKLVLTKTMDIIENARGRITYSQAHRKALKETKPQVDEIKKMFVKPPELREQNQFVLMKAPDGSIREIPQDKVKEAQAAGGTIVK